VIDICEPEKLWVCPQMLRFIQVFPQLLRLSHFFPQFFRLTHFFPQFVQVHTGVPTVVQVHKVFPHLFPFTQVLVSKHILTLRICIVKLQACKTAYKNTGINDTDHMLRLKIYQEKKCCHTQCPYTSHNVFRKGKICVKQNKYGKTGKTRVTLSNSRQTCV
jgi:hypothetical protein